MKKRIRVKFWGVRGSIAVPGRTALKYGGNTSCVEIDAGDDLIICDAGTGIRSLGNDLIRRYKKRPIRATILLSHIHWDHYVGLPFFKPIYWKKNSFSIGGPKPAKMDFGEAIGNAMHPPYFPIPVSAIPSKVKFKNIAERKFNIGKVKVVPLTLFHPGGAFGWKFRFTNGMSLVHVTDNEPNGDDFRNRTIKWMRGADVLIHDAQYTPEEYKSRKGWGHSPFTYPLELAAEAGVGRVIFFHFDPDATDGHLNRILGDARRWIRKRGAKMTCVLAREGMSFNI